MKKCRTNWHEAAVCILQIELRDYSHLLDFQAEYPLSNNAYRIDLVVIQKLVDEPIPKSLANILCRLCRTSDKFLRKSGSVHSLGCKSFVSHLPLSKKLFRH